MRLAHAYAVRALRKLGHELVSGSWSRSAEPLTEPQAALVLSRAMATVVMLGLSSVSDAIDRKLGELLGR